MDELIKKLAGFGIPMIILLVTMSSTGYAGAAALTAALSILGPGGMIFGVGFLIAISLSADKIAEIGCEKITLLVIKKQLETISKDEMIEKINKRFITKKLKSKVIEFVETV